MGEKSTFEQLSLPEVEMLQLGSGPEVGTENALSYAWHVIGVLAVDQQLDSRIDRNGHFIPYDFMEAGLTPLVANFAPLTNKDVWQLALELHRAYESMDEPNDSPEAQESIAA